MNNREGQEKDKGKECDTDEKTFATLGIPLGLCFGVVFGIIFDNLTLGIAMGLCFGTAFGAIGHDKKKD